MSDALDRYGGADAWDRRCEEREAAYRALIAGKTCLDCGNSEVCGRHPDTGYCTVIGDFVYADDIVADIGCEDYEE